MIGRPHERTSAPHRRRTRGAAALAGAIVAVLLPTTTTTGNGPGVTPWSATTAAAASDLTAARQRAAELRREITRLELAADVAAEDYLTVADQLDRATSAYVSASRVLGAARSASDEAELAAGRRARALYIAGGPVALYASVLTGADMREVMDRAQTVQRLIQADQSMVSAQHQVVASGAAIADRLERLAGRRTRFQRQAAAASERVAAVLARQRAVLAAADDDVRRLAAAQRRRQEAAAARAAAAARQRRAEAARARRESAPSKVGVVSGSRA